MIAKALILVARGWQIGPSRVLPPSCRFSPSCSAYAITAWTRHGALRGSWLAARRLLRCHPWGGMGHDPVPLAPSCSPAKAGVQLLGSQFLGRDPGPPPARGHKLDRPTVGTGI